MDKTDEESIKEFLQAKDTLNLLLYQEETNWKQRAKLFWLADGDEKQGSSMPERHRREKRKN